MEEKRKANVEEREKVEHAAAEAVRVIAAAAGEASKTIAAAAAAAAAAADQIKEGCDHDLLIELKTRLEGLRTDIQDLKSGTTEKISDHEIRVTSLEGSRLRQNIMMSIGIGILTLLVSLLVYHLFKI